MIEPGIHHAKWPGVEPVDAVAAVAAFCDEAGAPKQTEMLGDGGTGNRKGLGDAAGGKAAVAEQIEYGPARGIGECAENSLRKMCNRMVTHNA